MDRIKKYKSIRREIFTDSIIVSIIIVVLLSIFLFNWLYTIELSKGLEILQQRNYSLNTFIDGYFTEIRNTIKALAANKDIQNAPSIDHDGIKRVLALYKSFSEANKNISYIYSGYENGQLVINDYTPPEGYHPVVRPWYQSALEAKPAIYIGLPYQEIKTREWLVSTGMVLPGNENGIEGVVVIDSSINDIANLLQERSAEYKSSYSLVAKADGEIIIHHNQNYINKHISEITESPVSFEEENGKFEYMLGDVPKIAYYSHIHDMDWVVITVVEKKEITDPIIWNLLLTLSITVLIILLVSIFRSILLGRRFSSPLIELRKRVTAVINGEDNIESKYVYPNNEIGAIAQEIEHLTENELYDRSVKLQIANILLEKKNVKLAKISITDTLTGLYNRHKIEHELEIEHKRATRHNRPFSIIIMDIDHFKEINDTFGHQAGDAVLRKISSLLDENLRKTDLCGRWGGEEFLILCPETNLNGSKELAEKIRQIINNYKFDVEKTLSISAGCSELSKGENTNDLIRRADQNLYKAKKTGRNKTVG
ncbi:MAG: diguanylate cyclase [Spirochaetales bacterium]|nr:diguanylate cyclase [Spirochaetales bacterium]